MEVVKLQNNLLCIRLRSPPSLPWAGHIRYQSTHKHLELDLKSSPVKIVLQLTAAMLLIPEQVWFEVKHEPYKTWQDDLWSERNCDEYEF